MVNTAGYETVRSMVCDSELPGFGGKKALWKRGIDPLGSTIRTILHQKNNLRTIDPYDNRCGGYIVSLGPKNSGTLRLYCTVKDIAKSRIVILRFYCTLYPYLAQKMIATASY